MNDKIKTSTALDLYGQRGEIKELSERITKMLPGVRQMGEAGALALAQVACSMGLNPFTGEVWAIPVKEKSSGRIVGFSIMAGIKGLRRAAKVQAKQSGGIYPFYRPSFRLMTDEEKELADLKSGDKGLVCELEVFLPPNHPWYSNGGYRRYVVEGVGIWRSYERTKMEPIQVVRKRAEADALKIAFDLPFGDRHGNGDYIEGEYEYAEEDYSGDDPGPDVDDLERRANGNQSRSASQVDDETREVIARPYDPYVLKGKLAGRAGNDGTPATDAQAPFVARKWQECYAGDGAADKYHAAIKWLWGVESARELTKSQASATLTWLLDPAGPDETGDTPLHPAAPEEARLVLRQALRDRGQLDMFEGDRPD